MSISNEILLALIALLTSPFVASVLEYAKNSRAAKGDATKLVLSTLQADYERVAKERDHYKEELDAKDSLLQESYRNYARLFQAYDNIERWYAEHKDQLPPPAPIGESKDK